jgi:hypothetical protein
MGKQVDILLGKKGNDVFLQNSMMVTIKVPFMMI